MSKYIAVPILSEWLFLIDFSRFLCSLDSLSRLKVKELVQESKDQFYRLMVKIRVSLSKANLSWSEKHGIHLYGMLPTSTFPSLSGITRFQWVSSLSISEFNYGEWDDNTDCRMKIFVISACKCLKELIIDHGRSTFTYESIPEPLLSLEVLHINSGSDCTRKYIPLLRVCPNLREFMSGYVMPEVLLTLVVWCRKLQCLDCEYLDKKSHGLVIFHHGRYLAEINLSFECRVLFSAVLHYCSSLSSVTTQCRSVYIVDTVQEAQSELYKITRWKCYFDSVAEGLLDVFAQCTNLTDLELKPIEYAPQNTVPLVFGSTLPLRVLHLPHYFHSTEFASIARQCNSLRELYIPAVCGTKVNDAGLAALGKYCPFITHLDITEQVAITDAGFECIVVNGRLEDLVINWCRLTELTFNNLAKYCTNLERFLSFGIRKSPSASVLSNLFNCCRHLTYYASYDCGRFPGTKSNTKFN